MEYLQWTLIQTIKYMPMKSRLHGFHTSSSIEVYIFCMVGNITGSIVMDRCHSHTCQYSQQSIISVVILNGVVTITRYSVGCGKSFKTVAWQTKGEKHALPCIHNPFLGNKNSKPPPLLKWIAVGCLFVRWGNVILVSGLQNRRWARA